MSPDDLRRLRLLYDLTQARLATYLGVPRWRISVWERGLRQIPDEIDTRLMDHTAETTLLDLGGLDRGEKLGASFRRREELVRALRSDDLAPPRGGRRQRLEDALRRRYAGRQRLLPGFENGE
jgi:transcriptional regulator with XRE-family HTH domain